MHRFFIESKKNRYFSDVFCSFQSSSSGTRPFLSKVVNGIVVYGSIYVGFNFKTPFEVVEKMIITYYSIRRKQEITSFLLKNFFKTLEIRRYFSFSRFIFVSRIQFCNQFLHRMHRFAIKCKRKNMFFWTISETFIGRSGLSV